MCYYDQPFCLILQNVSNVTIFNSLYLINDFNFKVIKNISKNGFVDLKHYRQSNYNYSNYIKLY